MTIVKTTGTRLKEVDFSQFNLRDAYITENTEYLAELRDEALFSNYGITVSIRIPSTDLGEMNEGNVDEYSNFVDITWLETCETILPRFTEYRQNVSEEGMSADGTDGIYPLECIIPSKLHLPRNSRIIFNEYNSRDEKIAREWVVLGTIMKQLSASKTYTRIARCVPARQDLFNSTAVQPGEFIFESVVKEVTKIKGPRVAGTIFFLKDAVSEEVEVILTKKPENPEEIQPEILNPKFIYPYQLDASFGAKKLAISVLT